MALDLAIEGRVEGVVTYCLDKKRIARSLA